MKRVLTFGIVFFVLNTCYAQVEWTGIKPALEKRIEATSIAYQGKIYIFHGYLTGWYPSHTSEVYDPQTDTWSWLAPLPTGPNSGMTHNGSALVDDEVWLAGGKSSAANVLTNKVWIYNIPQDTWRPGPALPENIGTGSLIKLGRKLHLFGGGTHPKGTTPTLHNFCVPNLNTYTYDLDHPTLGWQLNKIAPMPEGFITIHHATAVYQGKAYVIGGQLGHDCGTQDKPWLFCYDPATDTWTRLRDMPVANAHAEPSTFVVDGKIIVTGGEKDNTPSGRIFEYNIATNQWLEIDHLRGLAGNLIGRLAVSAKVIGDRMFVSHGGSGLPVNLAYSKTFARNQVLALGFNPQNLQVELAYGDHQTEQSAWLWTTEGSAPFKIHPDDLPDWLEISSDAVKTVDESAVEINCRFNAKNLAPGTYQYKLGASAPGYTDATLLITLRVKSSQNLTPPTAPEQLSMTYSSRQTAQIIWQSSSQPIDFFEIFRADFGTANFLKVGQSQENVFTDISLQTNETYSYKVRAVNAGGSSPFSAVLEVNTKPYPPATPQGISVLANKNLSCSLNWQLVINEESDEEIQFEIYRKMNASVSPLYSFLASTSQLYWTDSTLKAQTEYAYIVRAVNSGGKSAFSKPVFITTPSASANYLPEKANTEASYAQQIYVYPNPGQDVFYLHTPNEFKGKISLILMDLLGNVVYSREVLLNNPEEDYALNLNELSPGMYLLKLLKDEKTTATYMIRRL